MIVWRICEYAFTELCIPVKSGFIVFFCAWKNISIENAYIKSKVTAFSWY